MCFTFLPFKDHQCFGNIFSSSLLLEGMEELLSEGMEELL